MALHGGGYLEFKKTHKGDFWGLFGIRLGKCPGIIPEKNQLSSILFQVPVFFSLMLLHYLSEFKTHDCIIFFVRPDILSREYRGIFDQVQTNYHGRPNGTIISHVSPSCWLWGILFMVGCLLSQLKPSELYILSCEKASAFGLGPFLQLRMECSSGFILYEILI